LFRITQEALTNVRKHAHARRVEIGLRRRADKLILSIQDDGSGFEPRPPVRNGQTHGLIGMRERARLLGGRLQVSSSQGQGTRVTARVPVQA
jgi:signal transduction histidine kinase